MGKGSRLRAQRASLPRFRSGDEAIRGLRLGRHRPGIEIAVMPGACRNTPAEVAQAKQQTHDALIEQLGHSRRSGIWWLIENGAVACRRKLTELYPMPAEPGPEITAQAAALFQFYEYFDQHGDDAVLVVASCEAMPS